MKTVMANSHPVYLKQSKSNTGIPTKKSKNLPYLLERTSIQTTTLLKMKFEGYTMEYDSYPYLVGIKKHLE